MKKCFYPLSFKLNVIKTTLTVLLLFITVFSGYSQQMKTLPAGAFIINMGVMPQTYANGLKPYGLVYALLSANCPVDWVIAPNKVKDGIDFTYNGIDYRGGPFIIEAEYRNPNVNNIISTFTAQGVVGVTTTSPITVPVYVTFWNVPHWTLDFQNGQIAVAYFANAGIPPSAYGGDESNWRTPAQLNSCDDVFSMPHAEPDWSTHKNLMAWNDSCRGGIWLGCHSGSGVENMWDYITPDYDAEMNFLSEKKGTVPPAGPFYDNHYYENALQSDDHSDASPPFQYDFHSEPIMQFVGVIDGATSGGAEQDYVPLYPGWRATTKVGVYDPDHPQRVSDSVKHRDAIVVFGRGYGDPDRGLVCYQGGHKLTQGSIPANTAAQRIFFNYSFLAVMDKEVLPKINAMPDTLISGQQTAISTLLMSVIFQGSIDSTDYTFTWSSSCGGTFTPGPTITSMYFTPPVVTTPTQCNISVTIEDKCGRKTFDTKTVIIVCNLKVSTSVTNPCYDQPNSGAITMTFTNGTGPYVYQWSRNGGGTGTGTLTTPPYVISGLAAGTYSVTVTAENGAGCPVTFTSVLISTTPFVITATPVNVSCYGGNDGEVKITVSGGVIPYTFLWNDNATTQNRGNLTAGTYSVTITDSRGCIGTDSSTVTQPDTSIIIIPGVTHLDCYGSNNGAIALTVSGGTPPYNYLWSNGSTSKDLTGLAAGTYTVTVTDANNCTQAYTNISVNQPTDSVNIGETHTNVLCYGGSTGSIDISVTGGTAPYTYSWTGPGSYTSYTEDPSGLFAGNYLVQVTDSKNCTASLQVVITQPGQLALTFVKTDPTCPPDPPAAPPDPPTVPPVYSNGSINLTVSGGTSPFTFSWTGPNGFTSTLEDLSGLPAGIYTVLVTDTNGCTATISATLIYQNPNPVTPTTIYH
ncbi:MAG TPA: SprB repeat-containing protein [Bacteroidales bacterium]|nr:SprB repeat-containing protein [Bacteroidales bacterium]